MTSPTNWPIPTDAATYLRHNEKRVLHEQRRPIVGRGSSVLGPGYAPYASQIDDWSGDEATFNGFYWTPQGASNAPANNTTEPYGDGVATYDTSLWLGHTVSRGDVGQQFARLLTSRFDPTDVLDSRYPDVVASRSWKTFNGQRKYSPWRGQANRPVRLFAEVVTALTSGPILVGGVPSASAPVEYSIYAPGTATTWQVDISVLLTNSVDTLASYRELVFYPSLNGSIILPGNNQGVQGYWSHYGRGLGGFHERVTIARTWYVYPGAGTTTLAAAIVADGANVLIDQIDIYAHQVQ